MKVCPVCGNTVDNNKTYCDYCGTPLLNADTTVSHDKQAPGYMPGNVNPSQQAYETSHQPEYDETEATQLDDNQLSSNVQKQSPDNNQTYNQSYNQPYNQPYNQTYNQSYNQPYNQSQNQSYNQPYNQTYNQSHNQSYNQTYNQPYSNNTATIQPASPTPGQSGNKALVIAVIVAGVILLCLAVYGAYIYLNDNDKDEVKIEAVELSGLQLAEGNTAYVVSRLKLRTTPDANSLYNVSAVLPVGTTLRITGIEDAWCKVDVLGPSYAGYSGWVARRYIVNARDFAILNSIFASDMAREAIKESYMQYALLQYFNKMNYIGRISDAGLRAAGLSEMERNADNQWQVEVTSLPPYASEMWTHKLINPSASVPDFAVIIKNIVSNDRRLLYFTFDENENATLYREINSIPESGRISDIRKKPNGNIEVTLTDY